ncbi:hypothetical protein D3C73_1396590 [compost metagenome]
MDVSNLAASQLVFVCVTRDWYPNCVSASVCAAWMSRGKESLSSFSVSCQSISLRRSTVRDSGWRMIVCSIVDSENGRTTTIRAALPIIDASIDVTAVRSSTLLR